MRKLEPATAPLFEIATPLPARQETKGPKFGVRTVRRVMCSGGAHQAGLIVGTGEHLVWRPHLVHNVNGSTWPCSASGKCLCQAPAPPVKDIHTPTCDDPTSRGWSW